MKWNINNPVKNALSLLVCLLIYTNSNAKNTLFPQVFFDEQSTKEQLAKGQHTLKGELFIKTALFAEKQYAKSNETVFLFPLNEYTEEYLRLRKKYPSEYVVMTEKAFQYRIETRADNQGNFQFTHLKPGKYLLESTVGYEAVGAHSYQTGTNYYGWVNYWGTYYTSSPVYTTYYFKYNTNQTLKSIVEINDSEPIQYTQLKTNFFNFDGSIFISPASSICFRSNGKQNGTCKDFYPNGTLNLVADWKDNLFDGDYLEYDENGKIKAEGRFEKGYKKGKWNYYKDGVLTTTEQYEFKYNQSALEGEARFYYANGNIQSKINYKDGLPHGKYTIYYADGNKQLTGNYKYGKVDGEMLGYYPNGELDYMRNYKDDVAQGYFETYYETGEKESYGNYVNNKFDGEIVLLDKNGSIKDKKTFVNGKEIVAKKPR